MAEYIDKEALVKSLDNMYNNMNAMSPQFYNGFMVARHHANEFSAADVVDVVRCKDCVYWQDNNGGYPHEDCRWGKDETPDADDFCSYGERKVHNDY